MKICTSYYGMSARLEKAGMTGIGISRTAPPGWTGPMLDCLKPSWEMLHELRIGQLKANPELSAGIEREYARKYLQTLGGLERDAVIEEIGKLTAGRDAALLCWEKNGFCHRHIAAEWLGIGEWTEQGELF